MSPVLVAKRRRRAEASRARMRARGDETLAERKERIRAENAKAMAQ
jgi:hypothetical protein